MQTIQGRAQPLFGQLPLQCELGQSAGKAQQKPRLSVEIMIDLSHCVFSLLLLHAFDDDGEDDDDYITV